MIVSRRIFANLVLATLAATIATPAPAQDKVVRIGHQKIGAFALLKPTGLLEERLKKLGYSVTWTEFPAGPQLLEAVNVGAVDFAHTGEAPPVFAQAAGAPIVYIAHEPAAPAAEAILVQKDSPIKSVADLKGKKVALNKGSNVHYLLVKALEKAGLAYSDVEVAYLPPADGRAAFEKGAVDAWVIWEPFRAAAEIATGARTLADGTGLVSNHEFLFTTKSFAANNPKEVVDTVLAASKEIYAKARADVKGTAETYSRAVGIPAAAFEASLKRKSLDIVPISDEILAQQQKIADTFLELGLIPKAITVSDAAYKPAS
ncbi:sulfonate ABC transporter substrate-binding protein [Terrihabitans soli]|uniref:Putative aliphatic sulfonates-binding protein n=1 Tax=Terrihabitans soli TaxID=708113 RepID=A0A6S6QQY0_9HYPH|nr:aliphatic sulfonate ABC transporter substrate-binding protein [Terrihabitans soli]BCJ89672.1 sulfonate ABC transporter substrate-binding protein [Terrihabitans soli]